MTIAANPAAETPAYHDLSWQDHATLCAKLATKIKASGRRYDAIVAVTRGGLFPAGLLANMLDIRVVETICISSYDGETAKAHASVLKTAALPGVEPDTILIVDDLVDTGRTAAVLEKVLPGATLAVLCAKPAGEQYATHYVQQIPQTTWVRFPWE